MTTPKSFRVFVAGSEIEYLSANLNRAKKELTGVLSLTLFYSIATAVQVRQAVAGAEITVYVAGQLAFTGTIDKRHGKGKSKGANLGSMNKIGKGKGSAIAAGRSTQGGGYQAHGGANDYTISLRARGKCKGLVDSSHDHQTGTITGAKTKSVTEQLIKRHKIKLDWRAPDYDIDKRRFRDGAIIQHEIDRIANENGLYRWEGRDGSLIVTDGTGENVGEDLILGENILEFAVEQSEEPENSQIKVKGQRTKKGVRGKAAVNREKTVKVKGFGANPRYAPLTIQHYGDGTDEALERRAKFEADQQNAHAKTVRVDVFHVETSSGEPWDIGNVHMVVIPTEGIAEPMECTELTYIVTKDKIETKLMLTPLPGASGSAGGIAGIPSLNLGSITGTVSTLLQKGAEIRAGWATTYAQGMYPANWGPLSFDVLNVAEGAFEAVSDAVQQIAQLPAGGPPLKLPEGV